MIVTFLVKPSLTSTGKQIPSGPLYVCIATLRKNSYMYFRKLLKDKT